MSTLSVRVVDFDPTRDKTYQQARSARAVTDWLAWLELGGTAARTLDQYERDLARLCLLYPTKELGEITDGDLLQLARQFKPLERRVRLAAVRSFFTWAKRTRRIADNPCDYLPKERARPQPVIDVFTDTEIQALLGLQVIDAAPIAILLEAGLRKAEARHLRLRHCYPETGQLVVRHGKSGRERIVPLSPTLAYLLNELVLTERLNRDDHIFYSVRANEVSRRIVRSAPIGEGTFARWWRACLQAAEVEYRSPHTARHTFATRWRRRGLGIDEVQLLLGHASVRTTSDLYVHTTVADVAEHMAHLLAELSPEQTV